jgi:glycosyltransferase involved in cell wall biosynthesis
MNWVDILTAERRDDFQIAQKFGFDGEFVSPVYITVGSEIDDIRYTNPSMRKIVLIKGYQDLPGRALNALDVVSRIGRSFPEVKFLVYSAAKSVKIRISQIKTEFGIDISVIESVSKQEMADYFSQARVAMSLAISDGLPASLVEAMRAGAFPIQSVNSAGPNMIVNGQSGFLVNPEDIDEIKNALICALKDDELVDSAYEKNICTLKKKYSLQEGRKVLRSIYTKSL